MARISEFARVSLPIANRKILKYFSRRGWWIDDTGRIQRKDNSHNHRRPKGSK